MCVYMCVFWLEGMDGVTARFRSLGILSCLPANSSVQAEGPILMKLLTGLFKILVKSF